MGVYHLMGLGRSPGAITGPISYLAHRYQRWNADDQRFFARSGEVIQRQRGEKAGDVQALVLFTTREVLVGKDEATGKPFITFDYIENPPRRITKGPKQPGGPMKEVLRSLLRQEWPGIGGGRPSGTIFWCEVDRRDIRTTYERIIQVAAALASVGGRGHEMWINLTGGNNVVNLALELAANLSGAVARLYYVQAENRTAESCVRFTAENGYWVDLPVMPLALSGLTTAILELLRPEQPTSLENLHSQLCNHVTYWSLVHGSSPKTFQETYLKPMWKQGLIAEAEGGYIIGPQWELVQPYEEVLERARQVNMTIEQVAQREPWIEREEIGFD